MRALVYQAGNEELPAKVTNIPTRMLALRCRTSSKLHDSQNSAYESNFYLELFWAENTCITSIYSLILSPLKTH